MEVSLDLALHTIDVYDVDDDDFVTPCARATRTGRAPINRPHLDEVEVFSNKRVGERAFKLRCSIEKLKPPRFRYMDEAIKIKDLVLSKDFVTKYREYVFYVMRVPFHAFCVF